MGRSRMTIQTLAVLKALVDDPLGKRYGLEISKAAGLPTGSVYPILARLEEEGLLASDWERVNPSAAGRPRRRFYWLTSLGEQRAEEDLRRALALLGPRDPDPYDHGATGRPEE